MRAFVFAGAVALTLIFAVYAAFGPRTASRSELLGGMTLMLFFMAVPAVALAYFRRWLPR